MTTPTDRDEHFMHLALAEARRAASVGEVPIGALVVHDDRILARAHNAREHWSDPTAHAELIALRGAAAWSGGWRLTGCTLYATIEPCAMCCGAALLSRVDRVVFGARDAKFGALGSVVDLSAQTGFNHRFEVRTGVLADACAEVMRSFFRERRDANSAEG